MVRKVAELMPPDTEDGDFVERAGSQVFPVDLDPDSELSWDDWIESLKGSEHPGLVRAYRVPLDADGNPSVVKGSRQILLGTWPHQQFSYDDLISKIKVEFLKPGETAAIRFAGTQPGRRGVIFNKIVTVQRAADGGASTTVAGNSPDTIGLLRAFQEATSANQAMMERFLSARDVTPSKPIGDSVKDWLAILSPLLAPVLLAVVNRPKEKSDLEGLIGAVLKLKGLAEDGKGGADDDSSTMSIIKAVAPEGLKLLTVLAQNQQPRAVPGAMRRIPSRRMPPPIEQQPKAAEPAPIPTPQTATENDPMLAQLKPQLDTLAEMAANGTDPAEVAKLVLETLPSTDEVDEQVLKLVSSPESFARLYLLSPAFALQQEWGEKLRLALLAEFPEEESGTAPTG